MQIPVDLIHDPGLEEQVVAALLADPSLCRVARNYLAPDAITRAEMRTAYRLLLDGQQVSSLITDAVPCADLGAAMKRITDLHRTRCILEVLPGLPEKAAQLVQGYGAYEDIATAVVAALRAGENAPGGLTPLVPSTDLTAGLFADLEQRAQTYALTGKPVILGIQTGLPTLDYRIGGLEPKTVTLLAARPNIGKSTIANQIAYHAANRGAAVLYASFENPGEDLILKQWARLGRFDAMDARRGKVSAQTLLEARSSYEAHGGERIYYHQANARTTVLGIQDLADRVRRHHDGPLLVVVDSLHNLAEVAPGNDDMRHKLDRTTQELRDLAHELTCPVLAVTKMNRNGYDRETDKPGMSALKESGGLEYSADVVLLLSDGWTKSDGKKDDDVPLATGFKAVTLDVAKNRYGVTGPIPLLFAQVCGRFEERATEGPAGFTRAAAR